MATFYYTFGSSKSFPYQGGWVQVEASDIKEAHRKFRARFPDRNEGVLNCSDYYTSEQFRAAEFCTLMVCFTVLMVATMKYGGKQK